MVWDWLKVMLEGGLHFLVLPIKGDSYGKESFNCDINSNPTNLASTPGALCAAKPFFIVLDPDPLPGMRFSKSST